MDQFIATIGKAVGDFFDSPAIRFGLQAIALYIVVIWLVTAFWAYRDLQSRTTNPVAPYLAAALIILFTPILFPFGVVLYKILRPAETVADAGERALAEEAMLVEVESQPHCANCDRRVHVDWIICPTCRNRLRRVCPNCSRLVELDWSLCAWCGKDFERVEQPRDIPVAAPAYVPPVTAGARSAPDPARLLPEPARMAPDATRAEQVRPRPSLTRPLDLGETEPERG